MSYTLYYWPGIPGRGEFVRLTLEEAGVPYRDTALEGDEDKATAALMKAMKDTSLVTPPFAPPFLKDGDKLIGQTSLILQYLGARHDLAPKSESGVLWTQQLQLTIADMVVEAHDAHHPLGGERYYEEQREEAKKRAKEFRLKRIPKFLTWFERVLEANPKGSGFLVHHSVTYADLSFFHLVTGLRYAFPNCMREQLKQFPHIAEHNRAIALRPRIAAYLTSPRCQPHTTNGIFRHYPELDPSN
jgi:glutathione S-transferase